MQAVAGTGGVGDAQSRHRAQRIAALQQLQHKPSKRAAEKAAAQREAAAIAEVAEAIQRATSVEEEAAAAESAAASLRAASTVQQQWQMAQRLQQNGAATTAQRLYIVCPESRHKFPTIEINIKTYQNLVKNILNP